VAGLKPNRLKERIRGGEVVVGTFMFTSSPAVMEILGHAGLDFVIVDTEHATTSPFDTVTLGNLVRAAEVSGVVPLVRLPERSRVMTQKVLDAGAMGIVVPWVKTREDIMEAVRDTKYPPLGQRGACYLTKAARYSAGFTGNYWETANMNTMVVPLIENQEAVDNLDEILAVDGIDFVFFGGRDYSMSCGYPTVDNPATKAAIAKAHKVCAKYGKPLARFLYPPFDKSVREAVADGATVLVAGGDVSLLLSAATQVANALRAVT
jgi:4-hydroxy-2-oxoheptanedioate aldolase